MEKYIRWWKWGRPADFWLKNIEMIGRVIQQYNLKSVPAEFLMAEPHPASMDLMPNEREKNPIKFRIPSFPGGIRLPHLHFKDEIYLLDEHQWKEFSGRVLKEFQVKMSKVNAVNFEQVMEMSEALDSHTT